MKQIIFTKTKALLLLLGVLVASTINAQETITEVSVKLDVSKIGLYVGNTEGNVNDSLRQKSHVNDSANYTINRSNTFFSYLNGTQWWGIGQGTGLVSADKTYGFTFAFNPKEGYIFPSDLSTVTLKLNDTVQNVLHTRVGGTNTTFFTMSVGSLGSVSSAEDIVSTEKVKLYPNPFQEVLNVETSESITAMKLTDAMGKVVKEFEPSDRHLVTENLAKGIYFLELQSEDKRIVKRVVKR